MMSDYITCKYAVATKRKNRIFELFVACDNLDTAVAEFDKFTSKTHPHVEQVAVFTRGQWNGRRDSMRRHKNLQERTDPIPSSVGMFVINQADSGYF